MAHNDAPAMSQGVQGNGTSRLGTQGVHRRIRTYSVSSPRWRSRFASRPVTTPCRRARCNRWPPRCAPDVGANSVVVAGM